MANDLTPTKAERNLILPVSPIFAYKKPRKRDEPGPNHGHFFNKGRLDNKKDTSLFKHKLNHCNDDVKITNVGNKFEKKVGEMIFCNNSSKNNTQFEDMCLQDMLYSNIKDCSTQSYNVGLQNMFSYIKNLEGLNAVDKNSKLKVAKQVSSGFKQFTTIISKEEMQNSLVEESSQHLNECFLTDSELLITTELLQDFATNAIDINTWNQNTQMSKSVFKENELASLPCKPKNIIKQKIDTCRKELATSMFSTARGKDVSISYNNLNKAKKLLSECEEERSSFNNKIVDSADTLIMEDTEESKRQNEFISSFNSKKSVEQEINTSNKNAALSMFNTANGKEVVISPCYLNKAKLLFSECAEEMSLFNDTGNIVKTKNQNIANDICAELEISPLISENASTKRNPTNNSKKNITGIVNSGNYENLAQIHSSKNDIDFDFQTAKGRPIVISEQALLAANNLYLDDMNINLNMNDNKILSPNQSAELQSVFFKDFTIANGKANNISKKTLVDAQNLLVENDEFEGSPRFKDICLWNINDKQLISSQTVHSHKCKLHEKTLKEENSLVKERMNEPVFTPNISQNKNMKSDRFHGFRTASGNDATISAEALSQARKLLDNNMENNNIIISDNNSKCVDPHNGNSNEKLSYQISTKNHELSDDWSAMNAIKVYWPCANNLEPNNTKSTIFLGFQTASGEKVKISAKALTEARELFEENYAAGDLNLNESHYEVNFTNNNSSKFIEKSDVQYGPKMGFQTASGKNTTVSKEALNKAQELFKEKTAPLSDESLTNSDNVTRKFKKDSFEVQHHGLMGDEMIDLKEEGSPILMKYPMIKNKKRSQAKTCLNFEVGVNPDSNQSISSGLNTDTNLKVNCIGKQNNNLVNITQEIKDSTTAFMADEILNDYGWFEGSMVASPTGIFADITDSSRAIVVNNDMSTQISTNNQFHFNKDIIDTDIFRNNRVVKHDIKHKEKLVPNVPTSSFKVPYRQGIAKAIDNTLKRTADDINLEFSTPFAKKYKEENPSENIDEDFLFTDNSQEICKLRECDVSREVKTLRDTEYDKQKIRIKQVKKKKSDAKPLRGSCLTNRIMATSRISWMECTKGLAPQYFNQDTLIHKFHLKKSVINVCFENIEKFTFSAWDHYSISTCKSNTSGILCGDGATIILDHNGDITLDRIISSFLASPGVDPAIISEVWIKNHFKWIILKLAAMERSFPMIYANRACTPNNLMLQLKYRYDREVDEVERSCLKRILEMDDTAAKPMILFCAKIYPLDQEKNNFLGDHQIMYELELSDGWYSIRTKIDAVLSKVVFDNKIKIGDKIYVVGSHLLNCVQGCDPLEVPSDVRLQIFSNSTTRARWDCRLGYTGLPPMMSCLGTAHHRGGLIFLTEFVIVRRYPIVYLVKQDGKTTLNSEKLEMKLCQEYEKQRMENLEKVYSQVLRTVQLEDITNEISIEGKSLNEKDIDKIRNPEMLFDLLSKSHDPSSIQNLLTESQKSLVSEHYAKKQSDTMDGIAKRVQEIMAKNDDICSRSSSQLLKLRIMPVCRNKDPEHNHSAILSIWRPNTTTLDILNEKCFVRANNCTAESMRNGELQLSAGRQASFKIISKKCDYAYPYRTYTSISEICHTKFNIPFDEVDTVGVVIHISPWHDAHSFQTVYIADLQQKVIGISFWGGIRRYGYEQVIATKTVIACSNLQLRKKSNHKWIPYTYATDMTTISNNPCQIHVIHIFETFKRAISKNTDEFVKECEEKLTRSKSSLPTKNVGFRSSSNICRINDMATPVTPIQQKIETLSKTPDPPNLPPLSFSTPRRRKLSKPYKPPLKIVINKGDCSKIIGNVKSGGSPPIV